ncbi:diacylglycerol kinase 1 [Artemisia annua]|uniref:Diacylglycerol kinase 1 n=1 Tax=Artemisia annua TaxID=35608 RepID=A0A2U1KFG2_ARTAN|nr:diacylglycerol kinase 1 [Artemisia annua]
MGSYIGGVYLWHNKNECTDIFDPQSKHDNRLEVLSISATWHLGKLQNHKDVLVVVDSEHYPESRMTNNFKESWHGKLSSIVLAYDSAVSERLWKQTQEAHKSRDDLIEAYRLAAKADPDSAFGDIIAFNTEVVEVSNLTKRVMNSGSEVGRLNTGGAGTEDGEVQNDHQDYGLIDS